MNFSDYNSLQSAIADELNRTDLDVAIIGFISLMEVQTERQLRTREMLATTTLTTENQTPLPVDFLESRNLSLNTNPVTPVPFVTIEQFIQARVTNPARGKPSAYTVIGDEIQFVPAPDSFYDATLLYYQSIPKLSGTNPTNWLLQKHPDIYFYGALLNSAPYLKEDPRLAVWGQLYESAVQALKLSDDRAKTQSNGLTASARAF